MKRSKLVVIGIDSLEPSFVNKLIDHGVSKGFAQFREAGIIRHLKSTFPPDTLLAWPTIYTGLLPYRFGLKPEPEDIHTLREESIKIRQKLKGKTFWDILSRKKKKVLVINPIFGYPPWKVNGFMVSGPCFGLRGEPLSQPPLEYISKYRLGTYGKTPLLPHEYKLVWNEALEQLISVFELTYKMVGGDDYDIVFFADYTLDRIQHYYWDFEDGNSASRYIWGDELRNAITNYYRLLDSMINWLINKLGDEYTFIVLGDHGHKARPHTLIALDDMLNGTRNTISFKEVTKHILYMFLYNSGLDKISYYFAKKLQEKNLLGRLIKK
ncbi:MAG: alkaline phosphatase family protein, partial [Thermosphaera sp.]